MEWRKTGTNQPNVKTHYKRLRPLAAYDVSDTKSVRMCIRFLHNILPYSSGTDKSKSVKREKWKKKKTHKHRSWIECEWLEEFKAYAMTPSDPDA